ncbi:MAG: hypothetical protein DWQ02_05725 [Bacteroidetes bacterium]|nr:MAG: hypothetical protein DWQ02_05725 [Bacteroidota bacterium]
MRITLLFIILSFSSIVYAQQDDRITTIDFVQILKDNKDEAVFYYQNNWKVLRDMAVNKGYIDSYQVLETPFSETEPFHLMLITTYANEAQYDLREDHFGELIKERGDLKLLNEKKPGEFRKVLFGKDMVRHWKRN